MTRPVLVIGNKNYSSWSLRPWLLLRHFGVDFEEIRLLLDTPGFAAGALRHSPTGKVPALHDGEVAVWDSLAICEYANERWLDGCGWPADLRQRALARAAAAEMHSGFTALRTHCGMNIEARLPEAGQLIWRDQPAVRADVARLVAMWSELLDAHGGPMLFGDFSIADAFFAPVCMRLVTFALPVPPAIAAYVERVRQLPGVQRWIDGALAEQTFLAFEEPYRLGR